MPGVSPLSMGVHTRSVKVALLGPVELSDARGERIEVSSRRQRQLLGILGLSCGRVVDVERISELIWGDDRPADPAGTVQTNISRLRRMLADPVSIDTDAAGYRLRCPADDLDLLRFESLVAAVRAESAEQVPKLVADVDRLWRGTPLADLDHPEMEAERQRLTELRVETVELGAEALYRLGRHGEAIGACEQLVRDHPYRERPVSVLMRSLFAVGRQADALTVFAALRTRLLDDLGVDPSRALRDVEMAILRQDLELSADDLGRPTRAATDLEGWTEVGPETDGQADEPPAEAQPAGGTGPASLGQRIRICVTDDGTRLAYATSGSGPPLVKAANWMTHLDYDWESPVWRHWNEGLARDRTLVRYDERGCGLSDWDVDRFSFDAWVDDLAAVVDAMELERFPLLGISQGGAVAIAYAVAHPERVSHLVLWGAYGRGRLVRAVDEEQRREADLHLELARVGWGTGDPTFRQVFTSQFMPDGTREQWEDFNELQRRTCSADNAVRFMEVFAEIDVVEQAAEVRCPTLILHSRNELRVPFDAAIELASLIPASELVPLESRNHILMENEPAWPRFLAELESFLADPAG